MFRVGQEVRVKSASELGIGNDYSVDVGGILFIASMKRFCNKRYRVLSVDVSRSFPIYTLSIETETYYAFTDGMLSSVKTTDICVGDMVRFKTWKELQQEFGPSIDCCFHFPDAMKLLCGLEDEVIEISDMGCVSFAGKNPVIKRILAEGDWHISTDMLKRIKTNG